MSRTTNLNLTGRAAQLDRAEFIRDAQDSGYRCSLCGSEQSVPGACWGCWDACKHVGVTEADAAALLAAWNADGCPEPDPRTEAERELDQWQAEWVETLESARP